MKLCALLLVVAGFTLSADSNACRQQLVNDYAARSAALIAKYPSLTENTVWKVSSKMKNRVLTFEGGAKKTLRVSFLTKGYAISNDDESMDTENRFYSNRAFERVLAIVEKTGLRFTVQKKQISQYYSSFNFVISSPEELTVLFELLKLKDIGFAKGTDYDSIVYYDDRSRSH